MKPCIIRRSSEGIGLTVTVDERLYPIRAGKLYFGRYLPHSSSTAWYGTGRNVALGGRTPFAVALTAPWAVLADDLLAAIDHGHPV